jgi:hypothetical protein
VTILDVCPRCGCSCRHTPDSVEKLAWCTDCGAACWTSPATPVTKPAVPSVLRHIGGVPSMIGRAVRT